MSIMFFLSIIFAVLQTKGSQAQAGCYYDGNEFCLNQEDILSVDLLPGSFLLMDPTSKGKNRAEVFNNVTIDGSIDRAIDEMDFHRKRMNEYLCHGFMAEEIFREMKSIRVKRRPDDRSPLVNSLPDFLAEPGFANDGDDYKNDVGTVADFDNVTVQHKLLSDEGSTKYKDWLQRTTTLDDVYRHYAPRKKLRKKNGLRHSTNSQSYLPEEGTIDEFDGEVTGFAMPASMTSDKTGGGSYYYDAPEDHMISSSTGHSYHPHPPPDLMPIYHEEHYYAPPSHGDEEYWPKSKGKGHELTIKDFFEIALTALAFLAFGVFIIQLLMNISNANMTTMPPVVTDVDGGRFKRHSQTSSRGNEELNELSHRVLRSIEAAMVAERDSGKCLRWSLCTDNNYSRSAGGPRKIWLPMWSLGMSWVSGRVLNKRVWPAMLESVKASILGLGGADCSSIYAGCDLARERIKRRRRRRK